MSQQKTIRIVIEVSGGMVQEIYSDADNLDIVLVDWDNIAEEDTGATYFTDAWLRDMPEETAKEVELLDAASI